MVTSYGNPRLAYADCSESCEYSKSYVSVSKAVYDGRPALPVQLHLNNSGLNRLFPVVQVRYSVHVLFKYLLWLNMIYKAPKSVNRIWTRRICGMISYVVYDRR